MDVLQGLADKLAAVTFFRATVERFPVALGIGFGVRHGAHISEPGDVVFFKKVKELVDGTSAVADGDDGHGLYFKITKKISIFEN